MQQIPLTRGLTATVDDQDVELVAGHSWYAMKALKSNSDRKYYAATRSGGRIVLMHRLITSAPAKTHVDHRDNDGLNNVRSNLRLCSPSQNGGNRGPARRNKGFKGVYKLGNRFVAYIRPNRIKRHLGCFATAEEAAHAYDHAAIEFFGEFARPNFPTPLSPCR